MYDYRLVTEIVRKLLNIFLLCLGLSITSHSAAQSSAYKPIVIEDGARSGDINTDLSIDVTDLNILLNILTGLEKAEDYGSHAYITGDNDIDVQDLNTLINMLLGKVDPPTASQITFDAATQTAIDDSIRTTPSETRQWKDSDRIIVYFDNDASRYYMLTYQANKWLITPMFEGAMPLNKTGVVNALFVPGIEPMSRPGQITIDGDFGICDNGRYQLTEGDNLRVLRLDIHLKHAATHLVLEGVIRPCQLATTPHLTTVNLNDGFKFDSDATSWLPYNLSQTGIADGYIITPAAGNAFELHLTYTNSIRQPREAYKRVINLGDDFQQGNTLRISGPHGVAAKLWIRDINFDVSDGKRSHAWTCSETSHTISARSADIVTITPFDGNNPAQHGTFSDFHITNPDVATVQQSGNILVVQPLKKGKCQITFTYTTATDAATITRTLSLSVD